MATKCDYLKGITAGLALHAKLSKPGPFGALPRNDKYIVDAATRKMEDKYREALDAGPVGLADPDARFGTLGHEQMTYIRAGYFREGVNDAMTYGKAQLFAVFHFDGTGHYSAEKLADRAVFADPSKACLRAWELDPQGHKFTSMALHYAHGAAEALGVLDQVAAEKAFGGAK